jgi:hypothetical protein
MKQYQVAADLQDNSKAAIDQESRAIGAQRSLTAHPADVLSCAVAIVSKNQGFRACDDTRRGQTRLMRESLGSESIDYAKRENRAIEFHT